MRLSNLNFCHDTLELKGTIENSFLVLGERLLKIRTERLYEPQWQAFDEYVNEMKMSEASANKLISIYQKFILEYKIPSNLLTLAGGWAVVAEILPVVTKDTVKDWLNKATVLSRQDLRKEVKEARTGIDMSKCEHKNFYTIRCCRDCGDRIAVHEEN
jgi:hypothetical protein